MRILFLGASELGWECCRALLDAGEPVVGIVTVPREFKISWSPGGVTNVRYRSFDDLAAGHRIPLLTMTKKMSDPALVQAVEDLRPDLMVVIGWYHLLPASFRAIAKLGAVGIHGSLLPRYRGGAPLVWAVIEGETRTGVTLFHLADGVDDGDVVAQADFAIDPDDEIADVIAKATRASVDVATRFVPLLGAGTAPRRRQDETLATSVPQRRPEDGLLDWSRHGVATARNWIRAQSRPYPGAFTFADGERMTIWRAHVLDAAAPSSPPGSLSIQRDGLVAVSCADGGLLALDEVEKGGQVSSGSAVRGATGAATRLATS
ncbi:MAG: methionyl-tRNA formyltransferase [Planctomycetota bacterium]